MSEFNIVVLSSCGGGNFVNLAKAQKENGFNIVKLICDRQCPAVEKSSFYNIPCEIVEKVLYKEKFCKKLDEYIPKDIDLIVLAGFMPILDEEFCKKWHRKIINTHPSLLPKYGGKGMYGVKVQEAVMANKEKYAGCTTHYVTSGIDEGEIIFQEKIEIDYSLTPYELGGKVFEKEIKVLIKAINLIKEEKLCHQ